ILRLGRLRLRGPCGAQFEFTLAAIAQNLRRLAKLVARPPPLALRALRNVASVSKVERKPPRTIQRVATDGFNKWHRSSRAVRVPTFTTKSAMNRHDPLITGREGCA